MNATTSTPKAARGRTAAPETPIAIRSRVDLSDAASQRMRERLRRRLGPAATLVERATIRFEDVNGPRGGNDTVCRIKLVLSGRPSVQVEQRGADPTRAFAQALPRLGTALERTRDKHGLSVGRPARGTRARARTRHGADAEPGALIGRRVGRGPDAMERALERPDKRRRDATVDTAAPGVSATDRKAGGGHTARRNTTKRATGATATLEDSRTTPSRKSTRRSANRGKPSQGKERAAVAASLTPSARAARANARR